MPENVPNVACWLTPRRMNGVGGELFVSSAQAEPTDTPATAIPKARLAEAQKARARLQARVDQAANARPSGEHILRDDHGDITIPIPIIRDLLAALALLGDAP